MYRIGVCVECLYLVLHLQSRWLSYKALAQCNSALFTKANVADDIQQLYGWVRQALDCQLFQLPAVFFFRLFSFIFQNKCVVMTTD